MKRFSALLLAILLIAVCAAGTASAAVSNNPRLIDKADVLTADQETSLNAKLAQISEEQECDVVILTEPDMLHEDYSFDGTVEDFADMYYESHGYAADGVLVLLLLDNGMGSRRIQFSCSGKCMKRLSDDEQNDIIDAVYSSLKSSDYYTALSGITDGIGENLPARLKWYMLPLAIGIGFVISMLIMGSFKKKLTTVAMQRGAASYVRPGSMNVTAARDTYLYSTVSRVARQTSSSGSSRTSSGGGSHSGVGRNF